MIKIVMSLAVSGVLLASNAQTVLFSTDFSTKPVGISTLSNMATTKGSDVTVVEGLDADTTFPKDTIIDEMTFSVLKIGNKILLSKGSQKPVQEGDYLDATNGRLSMKNSGVSVTLPAVQGPCTITYHAAGSSVSSTKAIDCLVNGNIVPEASFADLALDSVQATRKMTYTATIGGDVIFSLSSKSSTYIYDIEIVSSTAVSISNWSVKEIEHSNLRIAGNIIMNDKNDLIQILNPLGAVVLSSDKAAINLQPLVKGAYIVRTQANEERFTIVR